MIQTSITNFYAICSFLDSVVTITYMGPQLYNAEVTLRNAECNNTPNTRLWAPPSCGKASLRFQFDYGVSARG